MTDGNWKITLRIHRKKTGAAANFQNFVLDAAPDEYILDAIERAWAYQDRSLVFNHACHHSVCGACGMRINGVEKLTCITLVKEVTHNGGEVVVEPLRNFPVESDLVVNMGEFMRRMETVRAHQVLPIEHASPSNGTGEAELAPREGDFTRLVDCIECGLCISACPMAATSEDYVGPAVLAAVHQEGDAGLAFSERIVDSENGLWRCHSAYECTAVCPSNVDPAWRIMELRKKVIVNRFKGIFLKRELS